MAAQNRAAKITKLVTALKKQYKPVAPTKDRTLLETLLLACLLENSPHDAAEKAFVALRDGYFDWNEVRVTTKQELAEACRGLNDPEESASRLKTTLQSVFESFYAFDIEAMKKQNLGQSVKQLEKLPGTTRFIVAYTAQNALGGHSIAINDGLLVALKTLDVITDPEAAAGNVPGLERAVPKTKGVEVGSLLHQLGVEVGKNPYGQPARKRLLAIDPKCKDRLPKRPPKPGPDPPPAAPKPKKDESKKPAPAAKKSEPAKKGDSTKPAAAKPAASKPAPKKKIVKKVKKKVAKAAPTKKTDKPAAKKKVAKKAPGKPIKKKKKKSPAKRKPR